MKKNFVLSALFILMIILSAAFTNHVSARTRLGNLTDANKYLANFTLQHASVAGAFSPAGKLADKPKALASPVSADSVVKDLLLSKINYSALGVLSPLVGSTLVINEVYATGGSTSTTDPSSYNADFIELYNSGSAPFNLNGYTIQYANTSSNSFAIVATLPNVSIPANGYYLVQTNAASGTAPALTPNQVASPAVNLSGTGGTVLLINSTTAQGTTCPASSATTDKVAYGSATFCPEGTPIAAPTTNARSIQRTTAGVDTDANSVDFTRALTATPQSSTATANTAPSITSANNTTFTQGTAGSFQVTASGSPAPTFSVTSGTLPNGVTLSSSGLLSGTPTQSGTFTFTITATNGTAPNATQSFTLTVNPSAALPDLTISQSAPASVTTGSNITYTLTASNSGTAALNNVGVNFTLPTGVTYVASSSSCTTTTPPAMGGTGTVAFSGCTIAANSTTTLTVTVSAPATAQTITSDGTNVVIDPGSLIAESNEGNNTAAPVSTMVILRTTAATVSLSGQVLTADGRGITRVRVTLTDSQGNVRMVFTTSNGEYRFDNVEIGSTYILTATGKHYTFSQPVQVLNINDETNGINFVADGGKRVRGF